MALTLIIFLVLALMTMSVYVLGYTVRQRIELQTAVDNAAYSAALVQADSLSRIAVLNRALAWTYVQANRMHTDYIMNKWLSDVVEKFKTDAEKAKAYANSNNGTCTCGVHKPSAYYNDELGAVLKGTRPLPLEAIYYTGVPPVGLDGVNGKLELKSNIPGVSKKNRFHDIYGYEDSVLTWAANNGRSYSQVQRLLNNANTTIISLNNGIDNLISNLPQRILAAARSSVSTQGQAASFDWVLLLGEKSYSEVDFGISASNWFNLLTNESRFLGWYPESDSDFLNADNWNSEQVLAWWRPPQSDSQIKKSGLYREYKSGAHIMKWEWRVNYYGGKPCVYIKPPDSGDSSVDASKSASDYIQGQAAKPRILKSNFFGKDGAIVVAAKRKQENPFASGFLHKNPNDLGFHGAFSMNQNIWALAASRAGIRTPGSGIGEYKTTWPSAENSWNLHVDDWDAVMLPLTTAWISGTDNVWNRRGDATEILKLVEGKLGGGKGEISNGVKTDVLH